MRKMIGKKVAIASILLGIGICLFHYGFGLVKVGDRDSGNIDLPQAVRERIEKECRVAEAEACAVYGMKLTCELLRFSKKNDIDAGAANCVGYAQLCSAVCNYALVPTVTIDAVAQNASVTFTTHNFPANSTFSVSMGVYVSSWVPDPKPAPKPYPYPIPQPYIPDGFYPISGGTSETAPSAPSFNPGKEDGKPAPAPAPAGHFVSSFNGTEVGTFSTADGSSQTLTFQIPAQLAGANPIALWISDLGPCGFYSYNYFWNATTN